MKEEIYNKWLGRIFLSFAAFALMLGLRNPWLLGKRVDVLFDKSHIEYKRLWSYKKMMLHFWVWDIEKMKYIEKVEK